MLVLHPNSRCDVCLEGYHGVRDPVAISCGHIFCQWCLPSFPKLVCPLCRHSFNPDDVRKLHVDKGMVPPSTPAINSVDLDALNAHAAQLQSAITRVTLEGASRPELEDLLHDVHDWLITQPEDQFADLRAARLLLTKVNKNQIKIATLKSRVVEVEQACSDLNAELSDERDNFKRQLDEERDISAAKYDELERRSFDERELLLAIEKALKEDKERLEKECDEWRSKCDEVSTECRRLSDELEKVKHNPQPRRVEPRYYYLHDQKGTKGDTVAILKDDGRDSSTALKVQIVGTDNMFHLSPIPATQPIPDLPPTMMAFLPLTDDIDDLIDDDKDNSNAPLSSASRSIPIKPRWDSHHHARSNSSLLPRPDPDAMSISAPRSMLDVHMSSCSTSPNVSAMQYGPRAAPNDHVSGSYPRVPENMLGLRADPVRISPPAVDPEAKEQQERAARVAALRDVLNDPTQAPSAKSPRKTSVSDGSDRTRPVISSTMSSTRAPSPVSSTSHSYSASALDKEYGAVPYRPQLTTGLSVASTAAAERERARASSVNAQHPPPVVPPPPSTNPHNPAPPLSSTSLSRVTATRDREPATTPVYLAYGPQSMPMQHQPRPPQTRKQSTDNTAPMSSLSSGSLSKGKASAMGMVVPPQPYPSNLTRSMRAMQESPRVS